MNQNTKDSNFKSLLKRKVFVAPILKAIFPEFNNLSVDEIVTNYLTDPNDADNPYIYALNNEDGGFEKLNTRADLIFPLDSPLDYYCIINIEGTISYIETLDWIRFFVYLAKLINLRRILRIPRFLYE